jgi:NAD(P)-dependent dehydrogenase (short-subunit alcohol dehydrogenase family)
VPAPASGGWALVTGAAGGIGSAVCARLAALPDLAVVGLDRAERAAPAGVRAVRCDLAEEGQRERVLGGLLDELGPPRMWASCAGAYPRRLLEEYDADLLDRVLADNFTHVFWTARALVAAMGAGGGGRIVLVSSQAGASGGADPAYAAAKAAVTALGKSIARECAPSGIRCNVVSPGPTDTPMATAMGERREYYKRQIPIGRLASADEVAEVICMVLGSSQGAMTGATIDVDGGLLRR